MFGRQVTRMGAILIAVALATSGSAVALPQSSQARQPNDRCQVWPGVAQEPRADRSHGAHGRTRRPSFSATEIVDIDFRVRFAPRDAGDHLLSVRVFTPRKHLYQQIDVPFSTQVPAGTKSARKIEGYPRPVVVQRAEEVEESGSNTKRGGRRQVTARLPVAGTLIMQNSLYGDWSAEAFLGSDEPCAIITFEIRE